MTLAAVLSRMIERDNTVLPDPDSPTTPSVVPRLSDRLTPSTALTRPAGVAKWVRRSLTTRRSSVDGAVATRVLPFAWSLIIPRAGSWFRVWLADGRRGLAVASLRSSVAQDCDRSHAPCRIDIEWTSRADRTAPMCHVALRLCSRARVAWSTGSERFARAVSSGRRRARTPSRPTRRRWQRPGLSVGRCRSPASGSRSIRRRPTTHRSPCPAVTTRWVG